MRGTIVRYKRLGIRLFFAGRTTELSRLKCPTWFDVVRTGRGKFANDNSTIAKYEPIVYTNREPRFRKPRSSFTSRVNSRLPRQTVTRPLYTHFGSPTASDRPALAGTLVRDAGTSARRPARNFPAFRAVCRRPTAAAGPHGRTRPPRSTRSRARSKAT